MSSSASAEPPVAASTSTKWADSIDNLLVDTEGLKLFRSFLANEYVTHPLDFYLACVGLRKSSNVANNLDRLRSFLRSLYRKYLRSNSDCFVPLSEETRRQLQSQITSQNKDALSNWASAVEIAQNEAKALLKRSLYQQFLESDAYIQHSKQKIPKSTGYSTEPEIMSNSERIGYGANSSLAALNNTNIGSMSDAAAHRQSSSSLKHRRMSNRFGSANTLSQQQQRQTYNLSVSSASLRLLHNQHFIPRGDRPSKMSNLAQENPAEFARLLTVKLEKTIAEREKEEHIERCLRECAANNNNNELLSTDETTSGCNGSTSQTSQSAGHFSLTTDGKRRCSSSKISRSLATFVQSLSEQDDDTADEHAQSILEDHMSRVWDKTLCLDSPAATVAALIVQPPVVMSSSHRQLLHQSTGFHNQSFASPANPLLADTHASRSFHSASTTATRPPLPSQKQQKQGGTPTSSRNCRNCQAVNAVTVFLPSSHHHHLHHHHHLAATPTSAAPGGAHRHGMTTMDPNYHFDSGISIADTESAKSLPPFSHTAKQKVLNWMLDNDRQSSNLIVTTTTTTNSHAPVENASNTASTMAPPPPPVAAEVPPTSIAAMSDSDTQTKSSCQTKTSCLEYTTVAYKFSDEEIPYRSQLPGKSVTLRQFKQLVTKRGVFRFYFKHATDEFAGGCVNEEVVEDDAVLPLYDGKIFARVERIDASSNAAAVLPPNPTSVSVIS